MNVTKEQFPPSAPEYEIVVRLHPEDAERLAEISRYGGVVSEAITNYRRGQGLELVEVSSFLWDLHPALMAALKGR